MLKNVYTYKNYLENCWLVTVNLFYKTLKCEPFGIVGGKDAQIVGTMKRISSNFADVTVLVVS